MIGDVIALVREIVEGLGNDIPFDGASAISASESRIFLPDTRGLLSVGTVITVDEDDFTVTAVECEAGYVDVESEADVPVLLSGSGTLSLATQPLHFFQGTINEVTNDLNAETDQTLKYPFVWLVERMSCEPVRTKGSAIDVIATPRLFILDEDDRENERTPAIYTSVVIPMETLAKQLVNALERHWRIAEVTGMRETAHAKATFTDTSKNLLGMFSGSEISPTLHIYPSDDCC